MMVKFLIIPSFIGLLSANEMVKWLWGIIWRYTMLLAMIWKYLVFKLNIFHHWFQIYKIMFDNKNFRHIEKLTSNSERKTTKSHQVWNYGRAMTCIFKKHILCINEIQTNYVMIISVNSIIKWLESMLNWVTRKSGI